MKSGRFFALAIDSNALPPGMEQFHYLRIDPNGRLLSIYVMIHEESVEFFYASTKRFDHTRLFKIGLTDSINPQGIISDQLLRLRQLHKHEVKVHEDKANRENSTIDSFNPLVSPRPVAFPCFSELECWEKKDEQGTLIVKLGHEFKKETQVLHLCFTTLFLDFLFDLQHSDIFRESPHFEELRAIIRDNPLFKGITAKAEYFYQRKLYERELEHLQGPHQQEIVEHTLQQAMDNWLKVIMDEQSPEKLILPPPHILNQSKEEVPSWFEENMEIEMKQVIKDTSATPKHISKKTSEKIVDFYLSRLAYLQATKYSLFHHKSHHQAYWILLILYGLSLFMLIDWRVPVIVAVSTVIIILTFTESSYKQQLANLNWTEVANLFMPRLQITFVILWFGYLGLVTKIPNFRFPYNVFILLFTIGLIWLYLLREAKSLTPDTDRKERVKRVSFITILAYALSGIMGIFTLSLILRSFDPSNTSITDSWELCTRYGYDIAFKTWFNTNTYVVFTGLFVNLIFQGKKFTGF